MVSPTENFNIKMRRKPANIGSAGIETSTGVLGTNSVSKTEKGVKKIDIRKMSFKFVKAYQINRKINGIKIP